jgi:hypothetical protein
LNSDFTFTSPTLYIAYDTITAKDNCRGGYVGKTYATSIIPITGQISSLAMQYLSNGTTMNRDEAASAIAYRAQQDGEADPAWHQQLPFGTNWTSVAGARIFQEAIHSPNNTRKSQPEMKGRYITKVLDVSDLQLPIPAGAYFEALKEGQCYGPDGAVQRGCATIIDNLFVPKLQLQDIIKQVDPAFHRCSLDWPGGVLDPPIALRPTTVLDIPTIPAHTTMTAPTGTSSIPIPAGRVEQPLPSQTISAQFLSKSPPLGLTDNRDHGRVIEPNLIVPAILESDMQYIMLGEHGFSAVVIASQTLSIGGPAAKVSGQVVSLASQGLIVGATTIAIPPPTTGLPLELVIDGETATARKFQDGIVIESFSVRPGAPGIVVKNHTVSLSGTNLFVDSTIASVRTVTKDGEGSMSVWDESDDGSGSRAVSLSHTDGGSSRTKSEARVRCIIDLCLMWTVFGLAVLLMFF